MDDEYKDYGQEPYVVDIEKITKQNTDFRQTKWTGKNLQLTLMSIKTGGEVGLEVHQDVDQFIRLEQGKARVLMGKTRDDLDYIREVEDDFAILIPAGTWHNIINIGDNELKLYSIYAPSEHPKGTVHHTFEEAQESE